MGKNTLYIEDADKALSDFIASGKKYDVIYIDPPYDTGSRLSYDDKRSDWTAFIHRKMDMTIKLMNDDSVLFISIDDSRLIDLCTICDDVFGRKNRIAIMVTHQSQRSNTKLVNVVHEYVVAYAKNKSKVRPFGIRRIDEPGGQELVKIQESVKKVFLVAGQDSAQKALKQAKKQYLQIHGEDGRWITNYRTIDDDGTIIYPKDLSVPGKPSPRDIPLADSGTLHLDALPTRAWSSVEKIQSLLLQNKVVFLDGRPYEKQALLDAIDSVYSLLPFYSRQGTEDLKRLGIGGLFDTPKPVAMIRHLINMTISGRDHLNVLDYFGGSGTTMQACMELEQSLDITINCDIVQIDEQMRLETKPYDTATRLGITPRIPYATIKRLGTYLLASDNPATYKIVWDKDMNTTDKTDYDHVH